MPDCLTTAGGERSANRSGAPSPGFIIYGSNDPSETYTLFDVATPLGTLTGGTGGASAFNDLGSGTSYGSFVATPALGAFADVTLNSAGLAFLNASAGQVALGGAIPTLAKGATNEFLFNSTSASLTRQLILTTTDTVVPEPRTTLMLAVAVSAGLFSRKR
jgi:hypothetical protein